VHALDRYAEIWVIDFEYNQQGRVGNPPNPVCAVAQELHSTRVVKLGGSDMGCPPFDLSRPDVLSVGFYFPAESGCMAVLGWARPANVIDLFAEFRTLTNGLRLPQGNSLLGACAYFGINAISADEKHEMRDLILRGEPFSGEEKQEILKYCSGDVFATGKLFAAMLVQLSPHWDHALARGKYTEVLGRVEHRGIPIDADTHGRLVHQWDSIQSQLIEVIDRNFDVFEDGSK